MVEVWDEGFVEGAWDGCFTNRDPDQAPCLAGTGGVVRDGRLIFAAATDLRGKLYISRVDGALHVSNSFAFLLSRTGDRPDPRYGYFSGETLVQCLLGIRRARRSLPTCLGSVEIHEHVNLEVLPGLEVRRIEKTPFEAPEDYQGYIDMVGGGIARTLENAADPARSHTYRPILTLSCGYDSPLVAALARDSGCSEALTFIDPPRYSGSTDDDSGVALGERLGMEVRTFQHNDFMAHGRCSEAEFFLHPPGIDLPLASMEDEFPGRILMTGSFGDCILSTSESEAVPDLKQSTFQGLCGSTLSEHRLRIGYLYFPPLFIGASHINSLIALSRSESMKPWSVGGDYDRPLARRCLREAGVPDEMFGTSKRGSAWGLIRKVGDLSESSREDFLEFISRHPEFRTRWGPRITWRLCRLFFSICRRIAPRSKPVKLLPDALQRFTRSPLEDQLFHWSVDRMTLRYDTAFSKADDRA